MLDDLDRIPWGELEHAYGTAEDVPDLIRALASTSKKERQDALEYLYGNIWHQGTIYEATSYAVPFLVELAASCETPDRHEILSYLGTLADGRSYIDMHKSIIEFTQEQLADDLRLELERVSRTREAVKAGENVYLASLRDREHKMCCAAAYALSRFPEEGERYWAPLRLRYDEAKKDELVRCGIAIVGRKFSEAASSDMQWLKRKFADETSGAVRVALAVAMARSGARDMDSALEFLAVHLLGNDQIKQVYYAQPFYREGPICDIIEALCRSKIGRRLAIARFNELLAEGAPADRLDYCRYVLQGELSDEPVSAYLGGPLQPLPIPNE